MKGYLNGEQCWKKWTRLGGSLKTVREELIKEGVENPKTGAPPTITGIEKAAFLWAISNPAEARRDLERAWLDHGEILTDERWKVFISDAAKLILAQSPERLEQFLADNNLQAYY